MDSTYVLPEPTDPPTWVHVRSRDEMEAFYKAILPKIREAARACGYAIGVHGSMRRDLDLIAAPWIKDHADKDALALAVMKAATGGIVSSRFEWGAHDFKPCGRIGTVFPICWTEPGIEAKGELSLGHIDLAVMPDTDPAIVERLLADDEMHPEWHNGVAALALALGIPMTSNGKVLDANDRSVTGNR